MAPSTGEAPLESRCYATVKDDRNLPDGMKIPMDREGESIWPVEWYLLENMLAGRRWMREMRRDGKKERLAAGYDTSLSPLEGEDDEESGEEREGGSGSGNASLNDDSAEESSSLAEESNSGSVDWEPSESSLGEDDESDG